MVTYRRWYSYYFCCTTTTKLHPITYLFISIEQLLWLKLRKHITCIIIHYLEKYCCEFVSCHAIMDIIFNVVNNLGFFIIYSCNTSSPHRHFTLYWSHAQLFLFYSRHFAFHSPIQFDIQFNIKMIVIWLMVRLELYDRYTNNG